MRNLAIAAIAAAVLATATSGAALWRTRHLSTSSTGNKPTSELVQVPDATNKTVLLMGALLSDLRLKFKVVWASSTTVAKSAVISQNPAPGSNVPVDTVVELTVSNGSP
jgi:beta-lactam-binding protein with PASTA domain